MAVGALGAGLYALDASLIHPEPHPFASAAVRAAVYCGVGAGFAVLLERGIELRTQVAERDRQIVELRPSATRSCPPTCRSSPA